jgi:glycosyltransferase involved in cell wall biosynthesis
LICDLVIPALNERPNIDALFEELAPLREPASGQPPLVRYVILADNGSTDGTDRAAEAHGAIVVREPRRGYGAACLKALAHLADLPDPPDAVAFVDADLADDPRSLPRLLAPLRSGEARVAIGSRRKRAEAGALNSVQRFGNGLACVMMAVLSGRRYHDLGPFRVATWEALKQLDMQDRTWGWTVEMQMKAALRDIPVIEVEVPYRRRRFGRSKISGTVRGVVTAGTKIIVTIIALWWDERGPGRRDRCRHDAKSDPPSAAERKALTTIGAARGRSSAADESPGRE